MASAGLTPDVGTALPPNRVRARAGGVGAERVVLSSDVKPHRGGAESFWRFSRLSRCALVGTSRAMFHVKHWLRSRGSLLVKTSQVTSRSRFGYPLRLWWSAVGWRGCFGVAGLNIYPWLRRVGPPPGRGFTTDAIAWGLRSGGADVSRETFHRWSRFGLASHWNALGVSRLSRGFRGL